MIAAAAPLLQSHPTALAIGQIVMALVCVVSFYWAYRITRPMMHRDVRDLRQNKTETVVGVKPICNPGRRSTDRCAVCPLDESCLKKLPPLDTEEIVRDRAATAALVDRAKKLTPKPSALFVDDNRELGMVVQTLLQAEGILCRIAGSIEEALPINELEKLLITDWRLPDGEGDRLIAMFRQVHPNKPIIVVSALEHPTEGLPPYVTWVAKPFEPDPFISLVQQMLKG